MAARILYTGEGEKRRKGKGERTAEGTWPAAGKVWECDSGNCVEEDIKEGDSPLVRSKGQCDKRCSILSRFKPPTEAKETFEDVRKLVLEMEVLFKDEKQA